MNIPLNESRFYHIYNRANGSEKLFKEKDNYRFFLDRYKLHISPIAETYCYCLMPNHFHFLVRVREEKEIRENLERKKSLIAQNVPGDSVGKSFIAQNVLGKEDGKGLIAQNVPGKEDGKGLIAQNVPGNGDSKGLIAQNVPGLGDLGRFGAPKEERTLEYLLSKQFSNLFNSYTKAFNKQQKRMGSLFMKNFKRKQIDDMQYMKNLVRYIHQNPVEAGMVRSVEKYAHSSFNLIGNRDNDFVHADEVIEWFYNRENFMAQHLVKEKDFILI